MRVAPVSQPRISIPRQHLASDPFVTWAKLDEVSLYLEKLLTGHQQRIANPYSNPNMPTVEEKKFLTGVLGSGDLLDKAIPVWNASSGLFECTEWLIDGATLYSPSQWSGTIDCPTVRTNTLTSNRGFGSDDQYFNYNDTRMLWGNPLHTQIFQGDTIMLSTEGRMKFDNDGGLDIRPLSIAGGGCGMAWRVIDDFDSPTVTYAELRTEAGAGDDNWAGLKLDWANGMDFQGDRYSSGDGTRALAEFDVAGNLWLGGTSADTMAVELGTVSNVMLWKNFATPFGSEATLFTMYGQLTLDCDSGIRIKANEGMGAVQAYFIDDENGNIHERFRVVEDVAPEDYRGRQLYDDNGIRAIRHDWDDGPSVYDTSGDLVWNVDRTGMMSAYESGDLRMRYQPFNGDFRGFIIGDVAEAGTESILYLTSEVDNNVGVAGYAPDGEFFDVTCQDEWFAFEGSDNTNVFKAATDMFFYGTLAAFSDGDGFRINPSNGNVKVQGSIDFGIDGDTNLYRSAADVLKTDDNFSALSFYVGATQIVDASRNLTNIWTVDCGAITSTSSLTNGLVGEIATKNQYRLYLADSLELGHILKRITSVWGGSSWTATEGYCAGRDAGHNNTGAYPSMFGVSAGHNNTGTNPSMFGMNAGHSNTGGNPSMFGVSAGSYNTGAFPSMFGVSAGSYNTGAYSSMFGVNAGSYNTGAYPSMFGMNAGHSNTGGNPSMFGASAGSSNTGTNPSMFGMNAGHSNTGTNPSMFGLSAGYSNTGGNPSMFGMNAGYYNTGAYPSMFGVSAGYYNTGTNPSMFGMYAGRYNTGAYPSMFGYGAGYYNSAANNTALGHLSNYVFKTNAGGAKTFDYTGINASNDRVTITGHGFGANGTWKNVLFTQGTGAIGGLTNATYYQIYIVDANTISFRELISGSLYHGADITSVGTGTGHTLTPQYEYSNTTCLGYQAEPTASNQVVLGDANVTQVLTAGQYKSTLATGTAPLAVTSTTVCTNLNADLWDGYQFADYLDQAVKTTSKPAFSGMEPTADDTYYLGKNDDDTPKAWKGLILADQTDGKKYRIELNNGAFTITDLTD